MRARWFALPTVAALFVGLSACTTVLDTRRQITAAFTQYQLQESLSGRFSLRVIAKASNDTALQRGGQGHFDWLFYTAPNTVISQINSQPNSQLNSRHVLIWSTGLGQALGRLEWHVDPNAALNDKSAQHQFHIFDSQNRRLAPQEQAAWVAEILGQPIAKETINPLIEEIITAFARTARFPGPLSPGGQRIPQDFYFTHPPLVVSLRIIADQK